MNKTKQKQNAAHELERLLWLDHAIAIENHKLLADLKRAHDEIFKLKSALPSSAPRPQRMSAV